MAIPCFEAVVETFHRGLAWHKAAEEDRPGLMEKPNEEQVVTK